MKQKKRVVSSLFIVAMLLMLPFAEAISCAEVSAVQEKFLQKFTEKEKRSPSDEELYQGLKTAYKLLTKDSISSEIYDATINAIENIPLRTSSVSERIQMLPTALQALLSLNQDLQVELNQEIIDQLFANVNNKKELQNKIPELLLQHLPKDTEEKKAAIQTLQNQGYSLEQAIPSTANQLSNPLENKAPNSAAEANSNMLLVTLATALGILNFVALGSVFGLFAGPIMYVLISSITPDAPLYKNITDFFGFVPGPIKEMLASTINIKTISNILAPPGAWLNKYVLRLKEQQTKPISAQRALEEQIIKVSSKQELLNTLGSLQPFDSSLTGVESIGVNTKQATLNGKKVLLFSAPTEEALLTQVKALALLREQGAVVLRIKAIGLSEGVPTLVLDLEGIQAQTLKDYAAQVSPQDRLAVFNGIERTMLVAQEPNPEKTKLPGMSFGRFNELKGFEQGDILVLRSQEGTVLGPLLLGWKGNTGVNARAQDSIDLNELRNELFKSKPLPVPTNVKQVQAALEKNTEDKNQQKTIHDLQTIVNELQTPSIRALAQQVLQEGINGMQADTKQKITYHTLRHWRNVVVQTKNTMTEYYTERVQSGELTQAEAAHELELDIVAALAHDVGYVAPDEKGLRPADSQAPIAPSHEGRGEEFIAKRNSQARREQYGQTLSTADVQALHFRIEATVFREDKTALAPQEYYELADTLYKAIAGDPEQTEFIASVISRLLPKIQKYDLIPLYQPVLKQLAKGQQVRSDSPEYILLKKLLASTQGARALGMADIGYGDITDLKLAAGLLQEFTNDIQSTLQLVQEIGIDLHNVIINGVKKDISTEAFSKNPAETITFIKQALYTKNEKGVFVKPNSNDLKQRLGAMLAAQGKSIDEALTTQAVTALDNAWGWIDAWQDSVPKFLAGSYFFQQYFAIGRVQRYSGGADYAKNTLTSPIAIKIPQENKDAFARNLNVFKTFNKVFFSPEIVTKEDIANAQEALQESGLDPASIQNIMTGLENANNEKIKKAEENKPAAPVQTTTLEQALARYANGKTVAQGIAEYTRYVVENQEKLFSNDDTLKKQANLGRMKEIARTNSLLAPVIFTQIQKNANAELAQYLLAHKDELLGFMEKMLADDPSQLESLLDRATTELGLQLFFRELSTQTALLQSLVNGALTQTYARSLTTVQVSDPRVSDIVNLVKHDLGNGFAVFSGLNDLFDTPLPNSVRAKINGVTHSFVTQLSESPERVFSTALPTLGKDVRGTKAVAYVDQQGKTHVWFILTPGLRHWDAVRALVKQELGEDATLDRTFGFELQWDGTQVSGIQMMSTITTDQIEKGITIPQERIATVAQAVRERISLPVRKGLETQEVLSPDEIIALENNPSLRMQKNLVIPHALVDTQEVIPEESVARSTIQEASTGFEVSDAAAQILATVKKDLLSEQEFETPETTPVDVQQTSLQKIQQALTPTKALLAGLGTGFAVMGLHALGLSAGIAASSLVIGTTIFAWQKLTRKELPLILRFARDALIANGIGYALTNTGFVVVGIGITLSPIIMYATFGVVAGIRSLPGLFSTVKQWLQQRKQLAQVKNGFTPFANILDERIQRLTEGQILLTKRVNTESSLQTTNTLGAVTAELAQLKEIKAQLDRARVSQEAPILLPQESQIKDVEDLLAQQNFNSILRTVQTSGDPDAFERAEEIVAKFNSAEVRQKITALATALLMLNAARMLVSEENSRDVAILNSIYLMMARIGFRIDKEDVAQLLDRLPAVTPVVLTTKPSFMSRLARPVLKSLASSAITTTLLSSMLFSITRSTKVTPDELIRVLEQASSTNSKTNTNIRTMQGAISTSIKTRFESLFSTAQYEKTLQNLRQALDEANTNNPVLAKQALEQARATLNTLDAQLKRSVDLETISPAKATDLFKAISTADIQLASLGSVIEFQDQRARHLFRAASYLEWGAPGQGIANLQQALQDTRRLITALENLAALSPEARPRIEAQIALLYQESLTILTNQDSVTRLIAATNSAVTGSVAHGGNIGRVMKAVDVLGTKDWNSVVKNAFSEGLLAKLGQELQAIPGNPVTIILQQLLADDDLQELQAALNNIGLTNQNAVSLLNTLVSNLRKTIEQVLSEHSIISEQGRADFAAALKNELKKTALQTLADTLPALLPGLSFTEHLAAQEGFVDVRFDTTQADITLESADIIKADITLPLNQFQTKVTEKGIELAVQGKISGIIKLRVGGQYISIDTSQGDFAVKNLVVGKTTTGNIVLTKPITIRLNAPTTIFGVEIKESTDLIINTFTYDLATGDIHADINIPDALLTGAEVNAQVHMTGIIGSIDVNTKTTASRTVLEGTATGSAYDKTLTEANTRITYETRPDGELFTMLTPDGEAVGTNKLTFQAATKGHSLPLKSSIDQTPYESEVQQSLLTAEAVFTTSKTELGKTIHVETVLEGKTGDTNNPKTYNAHAKHTVVGGKTRTLVTGKITDPYHPSVATMPFEFSITYETQDDRTQDMSLRISGRVEEILKQVFEKSPIVAAGGTLRVKAHVDAQGTLSVRVLDAKTITPSIVQLSQGISVKIGSVKVNAPKDTSITATTEEVRVEHLHDATLEDVDFMDTTGKVHVKVKKISVQGSARFSLKTSELQTPALQKENQASPAQENQVPEAVFETIRSIFGNSNLNIGEVTVTLNPDGSVATIDLSGKDITGALSISEGLIQGNVKNVQGIRVVLENGMVKTATLVNAVLNNLKMNEGNTLQSKGDVTVPRLELNFGQENIRGETKNVLQKITFDVDAQDSLLIGKKIELRNAKLRNLVIGFSQGKAVGVQVDLLSAEKLSVDEKLTFTAAVLKGTRILFEYAGQEIGAKSLDATSLTSNEFELQSSGARVRADTLDVQGLNILLGKGKLQEITAHSARVPQGELKIYAQVDPLNIEKPGEKLQTSTLLSAERMLILTPKFTLSTEGHIRIEAGNTFIPGRITLGQVKSSNARFDRLIAEPNRESSLTANGVIFNGPITGPLSAEPGMATNKFTAHITRDGHIQITFEELTAPDITLGDGAIHVTESVNKKVFITLKNNNDIEKIRVEQGKNTEGTFALEDIVIVSKEGSIDVVNLVFEQGKFNKATRLGLKGEFSVFKKNPDGTKGSYVGTGRIEEINRAGKRVVQLTFSFTETPDGKTERVNVEFELDSNGNVRNTLATSESWFGPVMINRKQMTLTKGVINLGNQAVNTVQGNDLATSWLEHGTGFGMVHADGVTVTSEQQGRQLVLSNIFTQIALNRNDAAGLLGTLVGADTERVAIVSLSSTNVEADLKDFLDIAGKSQEDTAKSIAERVKQATIKLGAYVMNAKDFSRVSSQLQQLSMKYEADKQALKERHAAPQEFKALEQTFQNSIDAVMRTAGVKTLTEEEIVASSDKKINIDELKSRILNKAIAQLVSRGPLLLLDTLIGSSGQAGVATALDAVTAKNAGFAQSFMQLLKENAKNIPDKEAREKIQNKLNQKDSAQKTPLTWQEKMLLLNAVLPALKNSETFDLNVKQQVEEALKNAVIVAQDAARTLAAMQVTQAWDTLSDIEKPVIRKILQDDVLPRILSEALTSKEQILKLLKTQGLNERETSLILPIIERFMPLLQYTSAVHAAEKKDTSTLLEYFMNHPDTIIETPAGPDATPEQNRQRIAIAETLLGMKKGELGDPTSKDSKAGKLLQAHRLPGKLNKLSQAELRAKLEMLKEAGFTTDQRELLISAGIAGQAEVQEVRLTQPKLITSELTVQSTLSQETSNTPTLPTSPTYPSSAGKDLKLAEALAEKQNVAQEYNNDKTNAAQTPELSQKEMPVSQQSIFTTFKKAVALLIPLLALPNIAHADQGVFEWIFHSPGDPAAAIVAGILIATTFVGAPILLFAGGRYILGAAALVLAAPILAVIISYGLISGNPHVLINYTPFLGSIAQKRLLLAGPKIIPYLIDWSIRAQQSKDAAQKNKKNIAQPAKNNQQVSGTVKGQVIHDDGIIEDYSRTYGQTEYDLPDEQLDQTLPAIQVSDEEIAFVTELLKQFGARSIIESLKKLLKQGTSPEEVKRLADFMSEKDSEVKSFMENEPAGKSLLQEIGYAYLAKAKSLSESSEIATQSPVQPSSEEKTGSSGISAQLSGSENFAEQMANAKEFLDAQALKDNQAQEIINAASRKESGTIKEHIKIHKIGVFERRQLTESLLGTEVDDETWAEIYRAHKLVDENGKPGIIDATGPEAIKLNSRKLLIISKALTTFYAQQGLTAQESRQKAVENAKLLMDSGIAGWVEGENAIEAQQENSNTPDQSTSSTASSPQDQARKAIREFNAAVTQGSKEGVFGGIALGVLGLVTAGKLGIIGVKTAYEKIFRRNTALQTQSNGMTQEELQRYRERMLPVAKLKATQYANALLTNPKTYNEAVKKTNILPQDLSTYQYQTLEDLDLLHAQKKAWNSPNFNDPTNSELAPYALEDYRAAVYKELVKVLSDKDHDKAQRAANLLGLLKIPSMIVEGKQVSPIKALKNLFNQQTDGRAFDVSAAIALGSIASASRDKTVVQDVASTLLNAAQNQKKMLDKDLAEYLRDHDLIESTQQREFHRINYYQKFTTHVYALKVIVGKLALVASPDAIPFLTSVSELNPKIIQVAKLDWYEDANFDFAKEAIDAINARTNIQNSQAGALSIVDVSRERGQISIATIGEGDLSVVKETNEVPVGQQDSVASLETSQELAIEDNILELAPAQESPSIESKIGIRRFLSDQRGKASNSFALNLGLSVGVIAALVVAVSNPLAFVAILTTSGVSFGGLLLYKTRIQKQEIQQISSSIEQIVRQTTVLEQLTQQKPVDHEAVSSTLTALEHVLPVFDAASATTLLNVFLSEKLSDTELSRIALLLGSLRPQELLAEFSPDTIFGNDLQQLTEYLAWAGEVQKKVKNTKVLNGVATGLQAAQQLVRNLKQNVLNWGGHAGTDSGARDDIVIAHDITEKTLTDLEKDYSHLARALEEKVSNIQGGELSVLPLEPEQGTLSISQEEGGLSVVPAAIQDSVASLERPEESADLLAEQVDLHSVSLVREKIEKTAYDVAKLIDPNKCSLCTQFRQVFHEFWFDLEQIADDFETKKISTSEARLRAQEVLDKVQAYRLAHHENPLQVQITEAEEALILYTEFVAGKIGLAKSKITEDTVRLQLVKAAQLIGKRSRDPSLTTDQITALGDLDGAVNEMYTLLPKQELGLEDLLPAKSLLDWDSVNKAELDYLLRKLFLNRQKPSARALTYLLNLARVMNHQKKSSESKESQKYAVFGGLSVLLYLYATFGPEVLSSIQSSEDIDIYGESKQLLNGIRITWPGIDIRASPNIKDKITALAFDNKENLALTVDPEVVKQDKHKIKIDAVVASNSIIPLLTDRSVPGAMDTLDGDFWKTVETEVIAGIPVQLPALTYLFRLKAAIARTKDQPEGWNDGPRPKDAADMMNLLAVYYSREAQPAEFLSELSPGELDNLLFVISKKENIRDELKINWFKPGDREGQTWEIFLKTVQSTTKAYLKKKPTNGLSKVLGCLIWDPVLGTCAS